MPPLDHSTTALKRVFRLSWQAVVDSTRKQVGHFGNATINLKPYVCANCSRETRGALLGEQWSSQGVAIGLTVIWSSFDIPVSCPGAPVPTTNYCCKWGNNASRPLRRHAGESIRRPKWLHSNRAIGLIGANRLTRLTPCMPWAVSVVTGQSPLRGTDPHFSSIAWYCRAMTPSFNRLFQGQKNTGLPPPKAHQQAIVDFILQISIVLCLVFKLSSSSHVTFSLKNVTSWSPEISSFSIILFCNWMENVCESRAVLQKRTAYNGQEMKQSCPGHRGLAKCKM